ncbi:uridine kinase [Arthrobacter sp. MYb227]|uniref:uridine kinase family protein n=1 Tax=Arthrobacter sp. MYb227 TaxID=1848601 RepID=UPI000CFBACE4|nr:uridine kinase [Arthrobacter sp. MYb227]PQZ93651.1 uridine kinase [Arthrobacter sp. MYb227]
MGQVPQQQTPLILLGGTSGSGKSYLAHQFGRPHLELDNFYRELSEHTPASPLPQTPYGEVDWDHPGTWNCDKAVDGIVELLETGQTHVPNYAISTSSYDGTHTIELNGGPLIAEGIFVSEVLAPLQGLGLVVQAYYIEVSPLLTALRRFIRDVKERRKPILFLLKRGYALLRADRQIRSKYLEAGFIPMKKKTIKRMLATPRT